MFCHTTSIMVVLKIALLLCCATAIHGTQKIVCDFDNTTCTTTAGDKNWYKEVSGNEGEWPCSEPIGPVTLEDETPKVKSKFENTIMKGLSNCTVPYLSIDTKNLTIVYQKHCDHLPVTAIFQWEGLVGNKSIDGSGSLTCDHYDYLITVAGNYNTSTDKEGVMYINLEDGYKIDCKSNDKVVYSLNYDNNKEKSVEITDFFNKNFELVDDEIINTVMIKLLQLFIVNSNAYMTATPATELVTYYQDN